MTLAAAGAIGLAGLASTSQPANAVAWWVAPAIIGAAGAGIVGGAMVTSSAAYAAAVQPAPVMAPGGAVYVQPASGFTECRIIRERVAGGWRRAQICY
jgi:hypothetical protein